MRESLDLVELVHLLLKKLWLIALISVIGLLLAFGVSELAMTKQYTSSVKFYVSSTKNESSNVNTGELNTAQELVNTYTVILQSNVVLNDIIKNVGLNCTAEELKKMLTISSVNGTEVMEVKVTTDNPQLSADIANSIYNIAPDKIVEITKIGYLGKVDSAKADPIPTSPRTLLNCVVGFMAGLVLAVLYVILCEMFDQRIKGEEEIKKGYNIPVLGSVPNFHTQFKGGYEGYGR